MEIKDYQLGLLYMMHLLVSADGVIDDKERAALLRVMQYESIPTEALAEFEAQITKMREREIYQAGIEMINKCSDADKIKAFGHLYKMSEADGTVHVKEVRLLLYSIRSAKVEFNQVIDHAKSVVY
ncbi:MAG: TerB family tellurite resistance protein [Cyclobacteriaceae bacterium]